MLFYQAAQSAQSNEALAAAALLLCCCCCYCQSHSLSLALAYTLSSLKLGSNWQNDFQHRLLLFLVSFFQFLVVVGFTGVYLITPSFFPVLFVIIWILGYCACLFAVVVAVFSTFCAIFSHMSKYASVQKLLLFPCAVDHIRQLYIYKLHAIII